MKTILVTGGLGFIGSNFIRMVLAKGEYKIQNLDAVTYAGNPDNLKGMPNPEHHRFEQGDINEYWRMEKLMKKADYVVNFAAETHVDRSLVNADVFMESNIMGTYTMLEVLRKCPNVKRLIMISTDEVYGDCGETPSTETSELRPQSPYAATKAAADRLCYAYAKAFDLPITITRSTNNYGPYQYPEKLIPLFITNLLEAKKLPIYGGGNNTRDWLHVDDNCRAILELMNAPDIPNGEVFNIGSGDELSVLDITSYIMMGHSDMPENVIEHVSDRKGHVRRHAVRTYKLRKATGWVPKTTFSDGISDTVEWYKTHREWWERLKE